MEWISVNDRLPDKYMFVLVWSERTITPVVGFYSEVLGWTLLHRQMSYRENLGITHWMPLPEPPESEDE